MMPTPWQQAYDDAKDLPDFVDLVDSRFHHNGLTPEPQLFLTEFSRWLDARSYLPDSKGLLKARQAVARFYQTFAPEVSSDDVLLTGGTSDAYRLLFTVLATVGDLVLLPRPGYPLFEHLVQHARLRHEYYDQPYWNGWRPDAASVAAKLGSGSRFLVLISPNNPTGQTIDAQTLQTLDAIPGTEDVVWVVDEVFDACVESPGELTRPLARFPHRRIVTLNGISKRFGSPDLKLGWMVLTGPRSWRESAMAALEFANDAYLLANDFSQSLLPALFDQMDSWQTMVRHQLATNRRSVQIWMQNNPDVEGILPNGGIHGLWRLDGLDHTWDDEKLTVHLINRYKLALHPGFFYDVSEPGLWVAYSLLKSPSVFQEALERLGLGLSSMRQKID